MVFYYYLQQRHCEVRSNLKVAVRYASRNCFVPGNDETDRMINDSAANDAKQMTNDTN